MDEFNAGAVVELIQTSIVRWHELNADRPLDADIVSGRKSEIREMGDHRDDLNQVIGDLTFANCDMWHEQDKMRSKDDKTVLIGTRNMCPLNQYRNDLVEEIDEIIADRVGDSDSFSDKIINVIRETIVDWHDKQRESGLPYTPVTDEIRKRRVLGEHRDDPLDVARDIAGINTEIWHVEDQMRSEDERVVVAAVRDENPMNVHRSELVEEIDEILVEMAGREM